MEEQGKTERIEEIFAAHREKSDRANQEAIVEMLRQLQDEQGYLTAEMQERAASAAGVKVIVIQVLVRMYPTLKAAPYQHEIILCTGKSCMDRGAQGTLAYLKKRLKIQRSGLSQDKKIFLRTRCCLKHCQTGPNVFIDGKLYTGKTGEELLEIIRAL